MGEFDLIDRLAQRLQAGRTDTQLGIGDDAALIAPRTGCELAITTDTLIAGRHFHHDTPAFDIGYKSLAVNLSDLAAMAADPAWVTLALSLPSLDAKWCDDWLDGAIAAIGDAPVDIIGGDTTRGDLSITVTAIGTLPAGAAVRRDAARPGDVVAVTGCLGDAARGLELWSERAEHVDNRDVQKLLDRLCRPQWRAGARMRGLAHAAIDISDGLIADLNHILAASRVGCRINADALPISSALHTCCPADRNPRDYALSGGDDYELCMIAVPAAFDELAAAFSADCDLTVIGEIESGSALRIVDGDGAEIRSADSGWDHFG